MERIGIIGLGRMGSALAARLAGQGASVTGWTRSGLNAGRAVELGISGADTLGEVVGASDILITSLFDDAAVAEVLDAAQGLDLSGKLIIDTSTIVPSTLTSRVASFSANAAGLLDAPIAGGPEMVLDGTCGVFLGGPDEEAARALPILSTLSEKTVHVGPLGAGLVMKAVNNAMLQTYFAGLFEQVQIAKRAGLPLETVLRVLCAGPVALPAVAARIPRILGEDSSVGFTVSGILKDNIVFQKIAEELGVATPTLRAAQAMEHHGIAHDLAEADPAALIAHAYAHA